MYTAVDIVEGKLKKRLQIYKDKHGNGRFHRHLVARFRRKTGWATLLQDKSSKIGVAFEVKKVYNCTL